MLLFANLNLAIDRSAQINVTRQRGLDARYFAWAVRFPIKC